MLGRALISSLLLSYASAQTAQQIADYPDWATLMSERDFSWNVYDVVTDDGWHLTMFRITGTPDTPTIDQAAAYPLLFKHGGGSDGGVYAAYGSDGESQGVKLARMGYDVWYANSRGTRFSREHDNMANMTLEEYWAFDLSHVGNYDLKAEVDHIISETGKTKVTLIAYSQNTATSFYGLAKNQDYFADKIHRYIAYAPCLLLQAPSGYRDVVSMFLQLHELGVYNVGGGDESSATAEKVCGYIPSLCEALSGGGKGGDSGEDDKEQTDYVGNATPTQLELYWNQIALEGRFQEPQTLVEYAKGNRETALVPFSNIDRTPVTMMIGIDDFCPVPLNEMIYHQMTVSEKYMIFQPGGHGNGADSDENTMARLVSSIDTGYWDSAETIKALTSVLALIITPILL